MAVWRFKLLNDQFDNPLLGESLIEGHRRIGFDVLEHIREAPRRDIDGITPVGTQKSTDQR
jgi:hypothetical protein